ncbi:MAG: sulfatase/phosphatase domain-containing protein, partial [Planctomycetia bacterium]
EAVDQNVGRIVAALEKLRLTNDTIVIFTSDNGGTPQFTAPLRGSKGELYEGGILVPLVVAWPGLAKPGTQCDFPVSSIDIYPTLLELAGVERPAGQILDGVSLVPALRSGAPPARPRLFWHFPCYVGRATPSIAVREGDFKLIEFFEDGGHVELYNLRDDPHEERNLATSQPARAQALAQTLHTWQRDTQAAIPREANPAYDPHADRPRGGQK